jgi:hypothetical protein
MEEKILEKRRGADSSLDEASMYAHKASEVRVPSAWMAWNGNSEAYAREAPDLGKEWKVSCIGSKREFINF